MNEKASVAVPITAQVATVRHSASVPVNFQMARMEAVAATAIQMVVVQKANFRTSCGLRNPFGAEAGIASEPSRSRTRNAASVAVTTTAGAELPGARSAANAAAMVEQALRTR